MAANVIEILIRAKNDASRVLNELERDTAKVNVGLGGMVRGFTSLAAPTLIVTGAIAAASGAAVRLAKELADTVERIDQVTVRTGLSIVEVQVYSQILEEAGVGAGSLTVGLTFLSRAIASNDPLLKKLGITTKDTGEAFRELISMIANTTDESRRNEVAFKLLGRSFGDLVANSKALAAEFGSGAMLQSLSASGKLITEETAPAIRELDSQMDKLGRNWGGVWRGMQEAAVPAASAIVKAINSIFDAANGKGGGRVPARLGMFGAFAGAGAGIIGMPGVPVAPPPVKPPRSLDDNTKALTELAKMLREANSIAFAPGDLRFPKMPAISGPVPEVPGPRALDARHEVMADWTSTIDAITSSAGKLDEMLGAVFAGLESGFTQVFTGLLDRTQTFASAMKTLFRSLVNEILAQLARIAAARVFGFILNMIGVPGGGAAASAVSGGVSGAPIHPGEGPVGSSRPVVMINAIDERSFAEHFRAMGGGVKVVSRQFAEAAEW